jgi:hypothetical protein
MKTKILKAAAALTLGCVSTWANPHQSFTTEVLNSVATATQKMPGIEDESNQKKANTMKQEYLVSKITAPSLEDDCPIDDIFNVKLFLFDNEKGELRLYDGDDNLLGSELVILTDDERTGKEVKNRLSGKTKDSKISDPIDLEKKKVSNLNQQADKKIVLPTEIDRKRISNLDPSLLNSRVTHPFEDSERHAIDPIITFQTDDHSGTDRVSICIARYSKFIALQQSKVNKTCESMILNITCPDIDVFTTVILKARCVAKRAANDINSVTD